MTLTLAPRASDAPPSPTDDTVDRRDLDAVYRRHYGHVLRICLRMGAGDREWAEDAAQDVFLQLHQQPGALDEVRSIQAWLTTVATRGCLRRLRRDRFMQAAPVRWLLRSELRLPKTPEDQGIVDDTLRRAARVIQAQPPKVRAAFFLYYVDQKTVTEIGEVLGHTKGYVSKLLAKAKRAVEREELR